MNIEANAEQEQAADVPEYLRPDRYDQTLEGYLELLQNMQVSQRALNQTFRAVLTSDPAAIANLREQAKSHIDNINENRAEPVDINQVNPNFLAGLIQPNWSEHFPPLNLAPQEQPAAEREWEKFKSSFGSITMKANLEAMRVAHAKVGQLEQDDRLQSEVTAERGKRLDLLRTVATRRVAERKKKKISEEIARLRMEAASSGRVSLTPAEKALIDSMNTEMDQLDETWKSMIDDEDKVKAEQLPRLWHKANFVDGKRQLDEGLFLSKQMEDIIREGLPAASRGEPLLFVGHTGGAKTALAEYMSRKYFGEPELVSGYADANSYQMMGKQELRAGGERPEELNFEQLQEKLMEYEIDWDKLSDDMKAKLVTDGWQSLSIPGSTESVFVPGPVLRAMESGRPLILDEVNAMDAGLLKRFNKILQLRPGDTFTVQEDSGRTVTVQRGFFIAMTMNEKSKYYKGVDDLSAEFMNRVGANVYRVQYPDEDKSYADIPEENIRLIYAAICDEHGELPAEVDLNDLLQFVKASFVSQQIFTGNHGDGLNDYLSTENLLEEGTPGLQETVLAPRTMVDIARKVAGSYGEITFDMALRRFVEGIKNKDDRAVMAAILKGHGFLKPPEREEESDPTNVE